MIDVIETAGERNVEEELSGERQRAACARDATY